MKKTISRKRAGTIGFTPDGRMNKLKTGDSSLDLKWEVLGTLNRSHFGGYRVMKPNWSEDNGQWEERYSKQ